MRKRNRSDYLLIEILIAVFFLMLAQIILVQVFARSKQMTTRAQAQTAALYDAQNTIELLNGAQDPDALLKEQGFVSSHGIWTRREENYLLMVSGAFVPEKSGQLYEGTVTAYASDPDTSGARQEGTELFSLPCVYFLAS